MYGKLKTNLTIDVKKPTNLNHNSLPRHNNVSKSIDGHLDKSKITQSNKSDHHNMSVLEPV